MDPAIEISVIIPVYNTAPYIPDCLDSLKSQTFHDFEVIIVNDGSRDDSEAVYSEYLQTTVFPGVQILKQRNQGLSAARNAGLSVAKGKYIFFLDSDDWLHPDTFKTLHGFMEKEKLDVAAQFPVNCYADGTREKVYGYFSLPEYYNVIPVGDSAFLFKGLFFAGAPMKMYRADFIRRHQLRFITGIKFEDNPFWVAVLSNTEKIGVVKDHFYYYRCNRKNSIMSGKNFRDMPFTYYCILKMVFQQERFCRFRPYFRKNIFLMALKRLFLSDPAHRKAFYCKMKMIFRRIRRCEKATKTPRSAAVLDLFAACGARLWEKCPMGFFLALFIPLQIVSISGRANRFLTHMFGK